MIVVPDVVYEALVLASIAFADDFLSAHMVIFSMWVSFIAFSCSTQITVPFGSSLMYLMLLAPLIGMRNGYSQNK